MNTVSNLIDQYQSDARTLSIGWSDGNQSIFHAIWLRDNCRCEDCGTPETGRRQSKLTDISLEIEISTAIRKPEGKIEIIWSDSHRSCFAEPWLKTHAYDERSRAQRYHKTVYWDEQFRSNPPKLDFATVNTDDLSFLQMLNTVQSHGLCFLTDAPIAPGQLEIFAAKIGPLQESNFGRVQDLVVDKSKMSVANRNVALKPHTDEPYRASPPGLLLFHCIETDVKGTGSSIFMDGFELAEHLRRQDPDGFNALTKNRQTFRRHFADDVDLTAEFPVISVDAFDNVCGIRINDRVSAPVSVPADQVEDYYRGMQTLLRLSEDSQRMIFLTLKPGDVAVFDNHRILHGRTKISMNTRRWLQWLQINRGDFYSAIKIISDRLGLHRSELPQIRGAYS